MDYSLRQTSRYTENMDDSDQKLLAIMFYTCLVFVLVAYTCYLVHRGRTIVHVVPRDHVVVEVGATAPFLESVPTTPLHRRSRSSDPKVINS